ncbi:hypothetical protein CLV86_1255 [Lacinutrix venerupis]|uniref:DUF456 domain-containing protein n=1 Tax=Lacinutrix venerupis TaxID=1486034 RepID=A0AAC9LM91_9FLAO|nr:DUF456 domain-containing protein [Lacinutrix venerupis]APX99296.1 hypothetical protein BWR22_02890 [Lacinutrix venerupis]RLJ65677.1 hypothetical protein CLV86_1255 [Lacinutrix venerupis]
MDIFLVFVGLLFIILGLIGSFLPILPGPPLSWIGLLLLYLTNAVPNNWMFLSITLIIALLVFTLDYIIPAMGAKKFGGTKAGMIGTTIGLFVGILAPIPGGIIIGPFLGAFLGELSNKTDSQTALKAAFGSFIGFITGTFIKFIVSVVYLGFFIKIFWDYKEILF